MKKKDQVERETQYLNSDHPFNVVNVPNVFRTLILTKGRMYRLKVISIDIFDQYCTMKFNEVEFHMEKIDNDWMIAYKNLKENVEEPIKNTMDPEASEVEEVPIMKKKDQVERETQYLDSDLPFHVGNVPEFFQVLALMRGRMHRLRIISIDICDEYCTMKFNQVEVRFEKIDNTWMLSYKNGEEPIKIDDLEKSIIDHLWFVLKDPKLSLGSIILKIEKTEMDLERLNLLLQSMLDSIDHQIRTDFKSCELVSEKVRMNMDAIINALRSQRIGFQVRDTRTQLSFYKFVYDIDKHPKKMLMFGDEKNITIKNK
ncbi:hypothetical protein CAEBREN_06133 [Caenorhabditis brenneri]|uniref:DUF38 domain-containing protein n=1 Tax=Caenorhabditis brenneri TaxID=135651 RepID=G0P371_CAEBE|nr:hypothetical protein CAEBREN_06133 [Caenorhabditis brenneri]